MRLNLTLTEKQNQKLKRIAKELGLSPPETVRFLIARENTPEPTADAPATEKG